MPSAPLSWSKALVSLLCHQKADERAAVLVQSCNLSFCAWQGLTSSELDPLLHMGELAKKMSLFA